MNRPKGNRLIFFKIQSESGGHSRVTVEQFPVTIGRDAKNNIAIPDEQISRFHLRIKKRGRLLIAEDLESRNGTFVNGDRIVNSVIRSGDKIRIGATEIAVFSTESEIAFQSPVDRSRSGEPDLMIQPGKSQDGEADPASWTRIPPHPDSGVEYPAKVIRAIFESHGDMLLARSVEDAGRAALKALPKLVAGVQRSAVFEWENESRRLKLLATRGEADKSGVTLIQKALEDSINRQCVIFAGANPEPPSPGKTQINQNLARFVIPIHSHDRMTGLIHIEVDPGLIQDPHQQIQPVIALLERIGPTLETFTLRGQIDGWLIGVVDTLIATIEAKDTYTHGHSERVSRYSLAIADELKLGRDLKRQLLVSALCHDIGKIGVPDAVLKKASLLSPDEYLEMKLHPVLGAEIMQKLPGAARFLSGIKYHHEKWDGTGYPDGLRGEDIPFFGRIVGICDAFDAMVSGRAYSGFMDQSDAVERLHEEAEQFDPEILRAFARAHDRGTLTIKTSTRQNQVETDRDLLKIEIDESIKDSRKRK